ncbi:MULTISPECIES: beta-ketoacyl-ACP synthase [unclassified Aureimonas]|uniref:beta-ketoacyl-ACP synthase n=1 Tax=unclassified Aureimonas TaxID=2615206 RepID=UPI0006F8B18A|nr:MULTISPECIES: beta-ketoacyl-ACP synthase [unclassified Aureimonas]KQT57321.1 3-oxoacyl-ACP synthase [Aureimonas sp. Leaf427]KQT77001.1 3-oxoacyl-ACP synthase [Aureimonas sp. Leaf460]
MTDRVEDVLITGIGLVSSLGEGIEAHLDRLTGSAVPQPEIEADRFAPYFVHPLPPIDWSQQIPKKGDQRQMETWQKLGTYAAGLALADAGVAPDEETRAGVDMIVAAGGGERDQTVDALVMSRARGLADPQAVVNELLSTELRPTLFLAQLSNLLAGNISIVHKVTGSSRTFMGEEGAGISAVATAAARIRSGQSGICLVGGAFSAERKDLLTNFELGGFLLKDSWSPVFGRTAEADGFTVGSVGAFLVLESASHAAARGSAAYARLDGVFGDRGARDRASLEARLDQLIADTGLSDTDLLILSGATGIADLSETERDVLRRHFPEAALRSYGTLLGQSFEAQFTAGVALAAAALARRQGLPPFDGRVENQVRFTPQTALVTTVGHVQAEGVCVLSALGGHASEV